MNPPKSQPSRACRRAGRPTVKWLAGTLGFSEVRMRELLRAKTPPGFVRSKGGRWVVKGPITADRLDRLRRFYTVPEAPEMPLEKLQAFDAIYEEFVSWSKSMASAEKLAETHPLIGPVYRKFKALGKELSITRPEIAAARQAILDTRSLTPLDDEYWQSPSDFVLSSWGENVTQEAGHFPKKFVIIAAIQHLKGQQSLPPTKQELAKHLRISRATLFRWATSCSLDLKVAINTIFEVEAVYQPMSDRQARDLRGQTFGRQRNQRG
jgi:hypothetical protein